MMTTNKNNSKFQCHLNMFSQQVQTLTWMVKYIFRSLTETYTHPYTQTPNQMKINGGRFENKRIKLKIIQQHFDKHRCTCLHSFPFSVFSFYILYIFYTFFGYNIILLWFNRNLNLKRIFISDALHSVSLSILTSRVRG